MAEIDRYLKFMVQLGASDFHISTGVRPTYRVNGSMRSASADKTEAFGEDTVRRIVEETMPERNRKEFEAWRDTDFAYEIPDVGRFRVNAFVDRAGPGAVFRHIAQEIKSLEQLGMPPILATFCGLSKGLVIVTGPTGSGKG